MKLVQVVGLVMVLVLVGTATADTNRFAIYTEREQCEDIGKIATLSYLKSWDAPSIDVARGRVVRSVGEEIEALKDKGWNPEWFLEAHLDSEDTARSNDISEALNLGGYVGDRQEQDCWDEFDKVRGAG